MDYVVLDTDVTSQGFRGQLPLPVREAIAGKFACVTFVTVGELTQGMHLRNWGLRRQATLEAWLSGFTVIHTNHRIAEIWGRLSANGARRGRTRPPNDTWIAACCMAEGMPLATLNRKDFADLVGHGLHLIEPP